MSQPGRVVVTPDQAADLADLLGRLGSAASLDPLLSASEIRPFVQRMEARRRTCARCGIGYLVKRDHRRARAFCGDECRRTPANAVEPSRPA